MEQLELNLVINHGDSHSQASSASTYARGSSDILGDLIMVYAAQVWPPGRKGVSIAVWTTGQSIPVEHILAKTGEVSGDAEAYGLGVGLSAPRNIGHKIYCRFKPCTSVIAPLVYNRQHAKHSTQSYLTLGQTDGRIRHSKARQVTLPADFTRRRRNSVTMRRCQRPGYTYEQATHTKIKSRKKGNRKKERKGLARCTEAPLCRQCHCSQTV